SLVRGVGMRRPRRRRRELREYRLHEDQDAEDQCAKRKSLHGARRYHSPLMKRCLTSLLALCLITAAPAAARRYSAVREGDVVQLTDTSTKTSVSIMPSVGNIAFDMTVKGQRVLRFPQKDVAAFKASPNATGVPFMGPWINRLDEQAFYANGRRYPFDMALGNIRGAIPIHGFLTTTDQWRVLSMTGAGDGASLTSRLEFYRQPSWMKQWPFAHTIDMTYRLKDGVLEVITSITNM